MSHKVAGWVLYDSPVTDPTQVLILWAIADRADEDGKNAWPSQQWIAARARCSDRTVRRHLSALEDAGHIVRGDQDLVSHFRADQRPVVWDIIMTATTGQIVRAGSERPVKSGTNDRSTVSDNGSTTTSGSRTVQKRATRVPVDFTITDELRAWAAQDVPLVDVDKQLPEWVDYWQGTGRTMVDWVATWRNGMRKQQQFAERDRAQRSPQGGQPQSLQDFEREQAEKLARIEAEARAEFERRNQL